MREDVMAEPRLLQVFLSRGLHGVYEVSIVDEDGTLSCTCPGFAHRKMCKHLLFVREKMSAAGEYNVRIPASAVEALKTAKDSPESWREFVCRYLTPEVL